MRSRAIAEDFMLRIFDFPPGEYLITDLSDLSDFCIEEFTEEELHEKILKSYGLDVSKLESDRLVDIFRAINRLSRPT